MVNLYNLHLWGFGQDIGARKVTTGLRIRRKGLKMSSAHLLPIALITALMTLVPSVLIPGMLPAGHADTGTYTYNGSSPLAVIDPTQNNLQTWFDGARYMKRTLYTLSGYVIDVWCTEVVLPGSTCPTDSIRSPNGRILADPATNVNLYAVWTANTYGIVWDGNSGTTNSIGGSTTYTTDSSIAFIPTTEPAKSLDGRGWTFAGWFDSPSGGTRVTDGSYTPSSPYGRITIYAHWIENTVTWESNGATQSNTSTGATSYVTGSSIYIPTAATLKTGYTFDGWFDSPSGGTQVTDTYVPPSPYGPVTFYAHWTPNSNRIAWHDEGADIRGASGGAENFLSGSPIATIPSTAPQKTGYQFAGWFTAQSGGTQVSDTFVPPSPDGLVNFYAHWTPNSNPIAWHNEGADVRESRGGADNFLSGSPIATIPSTAPQKTGYQFAGWFTAQSGGAQVTDGSYTPTIYDLVEIWAHWTANEDIDQSYAIKWNGQGATTASIGGSASYSNGSSVTTIPTTAPQKTGYTFAGWFTDSTSGLQLTNGSYSPPSPYGEVTFYAHWSAGANTAQSDESSRNAKAKAEAEAAAAKHEAEKQSARSEITSKLQYGKELTVETFATAEIPGITADNIAAVQAEILALHEGPRTDINVVLKVARKYEVVGNIASDQVNYLLPTTFVEIGLIPATSKNKVALVSAIRKLPVSARDTYAEIKAAIDATTASLQARKDRLAAVITRNTSRNTK